VAVQAFMAVLPMSNATRSADYETRIRHSHRTLQNGSVRRQPRSHQVNIPRHEEPSFGGDGDVIRVSRVFLLAHSVVGCAPEAHRKQSRGWHQSECVSWARQKFSGRYRHVQQVFGRSTARSVQGYVRLQYLSAKYKSASCFLAGVRKVGSANRL
jgi:hypothetical protein